MKIETLQQLAKDCISVEIYRSKRESTYPHTDYIEYLDITLQDLPAELPLHTYIDRMDAAEYNRTINANCGEVEDYEGKIMIIVLPMINT